jgi:hypothetical protein
MRTLEAGEDDRHFILAVEKDFGIMSKSYRLGGWSFERKPPSET